MKRAPSFPRRAAAALLTAVVMLLVPGVAAAAPPSCDVPEGFSVSVEAGQTLALPAAPCSDPDGDAIQIEITRQPVHGTLSPAGTLSIDAARSYTAVSPGNDTIGFRALAGGEASDERVVAVVVTPAPSVLVVVIPNVLFSYEADTDRRGTVLRRLTVKGLPRGATVRVRCSGATCPRRRQTIRDTGSAVRLPRFSRRRLAPGTRLEAVVTAPGRVGVVKIVKIRRSRVPTISTLCIAPGETRRQACS